MTPQIRLLNQSLARFIDQPPVDRDRHIGPTTCSQRGSTPAFLSTFVAGLAIACSGMLADSSLAIESTVKFDDGMAEKHVAQYSHPQRIEQGRTAIDFTKRWSDSTLCPTKVHLDQRAGSRQRHLADWVVAKLSSTDVESDSADNTLTEQERAAGWSLLFNGQDLSGWKCNNGKPIATPVEEGCLVPYQSGGYIIIHEEPVGDFVLKCDVRWEDPRCNSGIFFRVEDPANPVNTGFEVQVMSGDKTGKHQFGAIYDLVATTKNAGKPAGEWNSVEIRCEGALIQVTVNGELVAQMDCDDFDQKGVCPDGEKHKFRLKGEPRAVKDFARSGYLGFQDHGHKVWYKNVKLLKLERK